MFLLLNLLFTFAKADLIQIDVNGMVCAFCANGIEKKFTAESVVESIEVDLDEKHVKVKTKGTNDLSDEKIKKLITSSGYVVTKIQRENK